MRVLMFQRRFAELVRSGTKRQTIRPERKDGRRTQSGDVLSLRSWSGKPYRSKQEILREREVCSWAAKVMMSEERIEDGGIRFVFLLDGSRQPIATIEDISAADGFADGFDMWKWFRENHGLPFKGDIIRW